MESSEISSFSFCQSREIAEEQVKDFKQVERLVISESSFCYKLRQLRLACEAVNTATAYFSAIQVEQTAIIIDIMQLNSEYYYTKGFELFTDLIKAVQFANIRKFLKVIIVYNEFIPEELKEIHKLCNE